MSVWKLVLRSLFHYGRLNVALLVGVALTAAILSGSLVVGDSVKESLRRNAKARIEGISYALVGGDRFFGQELADRLQRQVGKESLVAPVIQVSGTVATPDGSFRSNGVQVLGVDERFWSLRAGHSAPVSANKGEWLAMNDVLAQRLNVGLGDTIVVRLEVPGELSKDAALSGEADDMVTLRMKVDEVIAADNMGRYSLQAEQIPRANVFVSLSHLQQQLEEGVNESDGRLM